MNKAKAAGMRAVLGVMVEAGTPDIYASAKKLCEAEGVVVGYSGDDPQGEMEGLEYILKELGKEYLPWKIGEASSVRKEIQRRIDGKIGNNRPSAIGSIQSNGSRRSSTERKRTDPPGDSEVGGKVS